MGTSTNVFHDPKFMWLGRQHLLLRYDKFRKRNYTITNYTFICIPVGFNADQHKNLYYYFRKKIQHLGQCGSGYMDFMTKIVKFYSWVFLKSKN